MNIEELADYPALLQILGALWKQGKTRGAAIFVGAGFSRNAELLHDAATAPPLWSDLASSIAAAVYPGGAPSGDALRLAEEYSVVLGRPALEGLIRRLVPDEEWQPGPLHRLLVRLPWVDILTTNWDTLIERAAGTTLGQTFEVVRSIGDISTTRAPRVVKLHGSLPSNTPFIVSEEDYRTYPQVFAPFVNLVQQVLLENELCLLGFSGDDPNFLKWSGWVRDQLGASARRIHLVGAFRISAARRRMLEARNVSVVDLYPLVSHLDPVERPMRATGLFLQFLLDSRPRLQQDWPQVRAISWPSMHEPDKFGTSLAAALPIWRERRQSFPGWLVCLREKREVLRQSFGPLLGFGNLALGSMDDRGRASALIELFWQFDAALLPPTEWMIEAARPTLLIHDCWESQRARGQVMLSLLRFFRESRQLSEFSEMFGHLQPIAACDPELLLAARYEECLQARDELDFLKLESGLGPFLGRDLVWKARAAALMCELGDLDGARRLSVDGLTEAREHYLRNRDSLWALSRLAWMQYLARGMADWLRPDPRVDPDGFESLSALIHETKCDPWELLREFERQIEEGINRLAERNRHKELLFDAGTYHDHSGTIHFDGRSPEVSIFEVWRAADTIGIPPRAGNRIFTNQMMERAELLSSHLEFADYLRVLRILGFGEDKLLEAVFSRVRVACLSPALLSELLRVTQRALLFSVAKLTSRDNPFDQRWSTKAAAYAEVLSRIVVRLEPQQALGIFRLGLEFARSNGWRSSDLLKPLESLLRRSLSAMPPALRSEQLTDLLDFPLPSATGMHPHMLSDWPNPADWIDSDLLTRPSSGAVFAERVSKLIFAVADAVPSDRTAAAQRLAELYFAGTLTGEESARFAEALWKRRESEKHFPSDTQFLSHIFLLLPSPDFPAALSLFKERNHERQESDYLRALGWAAAGVKGQPRIAVFTKDEALSMVDRILSRKPKPIPRPDLGFFERENRRAEDAIGLVLANTCLPELEHGDLSAERAEQILALVSTNPSVSVALPQLVRLRPVLQDRAASAIVTCMTSRENDAAWAGFNALHRWLSLVREASLAIVPKLLIGASISVVTNRREPGLVHALELCGEMLDQGLLWAGDMSSLGDALGLIRAETAYKVQGDSPIDEMLLTLVRREAVRLSDKLVKAGCATPNVSGWLEVATEDPMPEVRFALL
jgi:hypothetical protein